MVKEIKRNIVKEINGGETNQSNHDRFMIDLPQGPVLGPCQFASPIHEVMNLFGLSRWGTMVSIVWQEHCSISWE